MKFTLAWLKEHLDTKADVETIAEQQSPPLRDGRAPKPPADWDEPSEPGKLVHRGGVADEKGAAPLGGPAGQH